MENTIEINGKFLGETDMNLFVFKYNRSIFVAKDPKRLIEYYENRKKRDADDALLRWNKIARQAIRQVVKNKKGEMLLIAEAGFWKINKEDAEKLEKFFEEQGKIYFVKEDDLLFEFFATDVWAYGEKWNGYYSRVMEVIEKVEEEDGTKVLWHVKVLSGRFLVYDRYYGAVDAVYAEREMIRLEHFREMEKLAEKMISLDF